MHMGRLSVSLEDDQEDWITTTSQELGISKGKYFVNVSTRSELVSHSSPDQ